MAYSDNVVLLFFKMDQPVELNDITGQNVRVDDGDGYETPHTFANNEYETLKINTSSTENKYASLKINTLADTTSTISGSPIGTVDGFDVSKPKFDAATFRRLRIAFVIVCIVLLALVIISSVTIGVLVHKLVS